MVATKQAVAGARHYAPAPELPLKVVPRPAHAPQPSIPRSVPRSVPAKARRSRALPAVLMAGIVVFGLVLMNIYLAQTSFALSDVQSRVAEEQSRHRQLRSEVAAAESPERISEMAVELGLVVPAQPHQLD